MPDVTLPLAAVVEVMVGPLVEEPWRVGEPLQHELSGLHSARRGAYRIVYRVDAGTRTVHGPADRPPVSGAPTH